MLVLWGVTRRGRGGNNYNSSGSKMRTSGRGMLRAQVAFVAEYAGGVDLLVMASRHRKVLKRTVLGRHTSAPPEPTAPPSRPDDVYASSLDLCGGVLRSIIAVGAFLGSFSLLRSPPPHVVAMRGGGRRGAACAAGPATERRTDDCCVRSSLHTTLTMYVQPRTQRGELLRQVRQLRDHTCVLRRLF